MVFYINTPVRSGFPSPAMDYVEDRININDFLIKHPLSTFIMENVGDSMIEAFIPPKAKLVVDRSLTPKSGDIVVAVLDGEFTVKYLRKTEFKCSLAPANGKYREIEITGEMEFTVWGVVTHVITDVKDVKECML